MADPFANRGSDLADPFEHAAAVTPNDDNDLATFARALYVGVAGDVVIITVNNETVTFKAHPVGVLSGRVRRVKSTGTTATNILALW